MVQYWKMWRQALRFPCLLSKEIQNISLSSVEVLEHRIPYLLVYFGTIFRSAPTRPQLALGPAEG